MIQKNKITRMAIITAFLLMIPLVTMQFSDEVDWNLFDFIVMGILLMGTGLAYEFLASKVKNMKHRLAIGIAVLLVFMLIWAELAVGLFGSPFAGS